ncbi:DUF484 family protein [Thiomicrorhabdus sp. Kp2]|uniref:DUF484 family protein n=1 Tax=Thiomicrorhabdus sp. Kp2 TaxID=1123518 RepID=UPI00041D9063|nr:DUF484 family protein [Thiomicrorhabdus sp. Kp2]MDX1351880.1 DUF484 family protein [Thiomicrorhabdus sp.]
MNMKAVSGPLSKTKLSAEEVASYLNQNPTFFHVFPNLLDSLSIPHPKSGKAVSLLERQVYQLREQRDALKIEVETLMDIASENGQLFYKVQQFTKALMAAQSEQASVTTVYEQMHNLFEVDQVAMVSWDVPSKSLEGINQLGVSQTWNEALKTSLTVHKPVCGLLENEWQKGLFHTDEAMQSVCLLPLGDEEVWGVLALGSKTNRFHPDLGTYFLNMMAELVTARLNHLFIK